mmetsp:Transcript_84447/g.225653  ORF Transcript_84447/g.225653 Transcript_84447/m.225653 type:complete len:237 (+) Transcript_84447:33-743(+)
MRLVAALAWAGAASKVVEEITPFNWQATMDSGKAAFIKFVKPNCPKCEVLKHEWDPLAQEMAKEQNIVVGVFNCHWPKAKKKAQKICGDFQIRGYPHIRYFTPDTGLKGARYDEDQGYSTAKFKEFAQTILPCDLETRERCSKEEAEFLEQASKLTAGDVSSQISKLKREVADGDTKESDKKATFLAAHVMAEGAKADALQKEFDKFVAAHGLEQSWRRKQLRILRHVSSAGKKEL